MIGQLFDPLGNRIGGEFQLNTSFSLDDEQDMAIAALPGGGFIQVYKDTDATATSLRLQERTATGATATASATIVSDASAADPAFRNPKIAVSSDTSALIVYKAVFGGNADIVYKLYDPATNTYSAQFGLFNELESVTNADVTVLSNGNYVVTANVGGADPSIRYTIFSPTQSEILGPTFVAGTNTNTFIDGQATVTALTGGGFVIAWTNTDAGDTDVVGRIYDAAGNETGSFFAGSGSATRTTSRRPSRRSPTAASSSSTATT